jgi:hypothetical protein
VVAGAAAATEGGVAVVPREAGIVAAATGDGCRAEAHPVSATIPATAAIDRQTKARGDRAW